jgi:hypothetical protein
MSGIFVIDARYCTVILGPVSIHGYTTVQVHICISWRSPYLQGSPFLKTLPSLELSSHGVELGGVSLPPPTGTSLEGGRTHNKSRSSALSDSSNHMLAFALLTHL